MKIKSTRCIVISYVGRSKMAVIDQKYQDIKKTFVDINEARNIAWNHHDSSKLPTHEPRLYSIVADARGRNFFLLPVVNKAIDEADAIFISVNSLTQTYGKVKDMAADLL